MLSANELEAIRTDVLSLLPDTGYILSATQTGDGQGGFTVTWGTAGTVEYRLDPLNMREREQLAGAAIDSFRAYRLTLPYDTTIEATHRFQAEDGTHYSVIAVDDGKSWQASVRCLVERI